jgi:holo-[acyl-carrier protein] synthase
MVGTDIIEVYRIEKLIKEKGDKFLNKIYTQKEIDYCESKGPNKYQHYAGRFAAKEAIFKTLAKPYNTIGSPRFKEAEILNTDTGSPYLAICGHYLDGIDISISHIKEYAVAVAILDSDLFDWGEYKILLNINND